MTRKSRREIETELADLDRHSSSGTAVPMVVPDTALPGDHADRDLSGEGCRRTVDGAECDLRLPYHRPRGLFGDGLPLITEAGIARLWRSLPDQVAETERELRRARDEPIPAALGGDAEA